MKIREILKDVDQYVDTEVKVQGWIRNSRFGKNVGFIELNDGSTFSNLQIVIGADYPSYDELSHLFLSSSIEVVGKFVATGNKKTPYEIQAEKVKVLGESSDKFPIQKQRQTLEFMRTIPHLRPRTNTYRAVFKVRSSLALSLIHI